MATRKSRLISIALAFCPPEFRTEFGEQIYADAAERGNTFPIALDILWQGLRLYRESFLRDIIFALRVLRKDLLFTAAVIGTLAIAISVNVVAFGAINAVLFKQLPFANADRLAFICQSVFSNSNKPACNVSGFEATNVKAFTTMRGSVERAAMFQITFEPTAGSGTPQNRTVAWTSTGFFDVLRVRPEIGRLFNNTDGQPGTHHIVISDKLWRNLYGAKIDALGKSITLDGTSQQIIGVVPPGFVMPDPTDREFNPETVDIFEAAPNTIADWKSHEVQSAFPVLQASIIARLRPGVSHAAAQDQLNRLDIPFRQGLMPMLKARSLQLVPNPVFAPIRAWYSSLNNTRSLLTIAFLAALAVLLIACANVANLLLARGTARQGELAVRSALGASRGRIIQQLLIEMVVLALVSGVIGAALAYVEFQLLMILNPDLLPRMRDISLDGRVVLFIFVTMAVATAIGGIFPAFLTTPQNLVDTLKSAGRGRDGAAGKVFRSALVVLEITVAFAVLISATLLVRSFISLTQAPQGFNPHNAYIAAIDLPSRRYVTASSYATFVKAAVARIQAIPGVELVAASRGRTYLLKNYLQYGPDGSVGILMPGSPGPSLSIKVTPLYFASLGTRILRGRDFTEQDRPGSPPVIIVSQLVAKMLAPHGDVVGKHARIVLTDATRHQTFEQATIVGVVEDATAAAGVPIYESYVPFAQYPVSRFELSIRTHLADPHLRTEVTSAITSIDPNVGISRFDSLDDEVTEAQTPQRTSATLLSAMAVVALLLALVGIYAIVSYGVERRTHEFGIRKAVGAQTSDILRIVLRGAAVYAIAGIGLGIIVAAFSTRALGNLLTQTSPFDPIAFLFVIALLVLSTLLAAIVPALRAMRVDPVTALRYE